MTTARALLTPPSGQALGRTLLLLGLVAWLASCGPSKQEQQIKELTTEIQQIDSAKTNLETTIDSLSRQKENLVAEAQSSKATAADLATKLRAANSGIVAVRQKNQQLTVQLNEWKDRAAKLSQENEALKAQIAGLTRRAEEAEARVARAESRAEAAEAKVRQYEGLLAKTYYVSRLNVVGFKGKEEYRKDKIKPGATSIRFDVTLSRPEGVKGSEPALKLEILNEKNQPFASVPLTVTGEQATATLDIKTGKLDLNTGKHTVRVMDTADGSEKFEGFFMVSR